MQPLETHTARNTKESSLGWKEMILDRNVDLQKEMKGVGRSKLLGKNGRPFLFQTI